MQHLSDFIKMKSISSTCQMQELVRFCAYHRIKPHTPPLV